MATGTTFPAKATSALPMRQLPQTGILTVAATASPPRSTATCGFPVNNGATSRIQAATGTITTASDGAGRQDMDSRGGRPVGGAGISGGRPLALLRHNL